MKPIWSSARDCLHPKEGIQGALQIATLQIATLQKALLPPPRNLMPAGVAFFGCTRRPGAAPICRTRATQRREQLAQLPLPVHSSGASRIAACGSRPARSRPATRISPASGTRLTLPSPGRGVGCPQCQLMLTVLAVTVHPRLRSLNHSPLGRALGQAAGTHSAGPLSAKG